MLQIVRIFFQLICLTLICIFLHTTAQASPFIIVSKLKLYVERSRLRQELRMLFFSRTGPRVWNMTPPKLRD